MSKDCTDENIIAKIFEPDARSEKQAVKCLKKCAVPTNEVLWRMSCRDPAERRSMFNLAATEFFIQVRQGKFVLTGKAAICTYVIEIAKNKWKEISLREKPDMSALPKTGRDNYDHLEEKVRQLGDDDRDILTAFYFYDQSLDAYAERNGISHDSAKKRISRARDRLRDLLKPPKK